MDGSNLFATVSITRLAKSETREKSERSEKVKGGGKN